jgi:hypothetical protein
MAKQQRFTDDIDRLAAYRTWRYSIGKDRHYVLDVDQVEYRLRGGKLVPVAVLEMTRADVAGADPDRKLLHDIRTRSTWQREALEHIATLLGVPLYIVVYHAHLEEYFILAATGVELAHIIGRKRYADWLEAL